MCESSDFEAHHKHTSHKKRENQSRNTSQKPNEIQKQSTSHERSEIHQCDASQIGMKSIIRMRAHKRANLCLKQL